MYFSPFGALSSDKALFFHLNFSGGLPKIV